MIQVENVNSLLIEASKLLVDNGVPRNVRGHACVEFAEPVCFRISNPEDRLITLEARKWNVFLAYAESLWIATGRNDLSLIGHYLNRLAEYSDDGQTLRGGYGPRLRAFDNSTTDYHVESVRHVYTEPFWINSPVVDQLQFVLDCFKEDINTRQAIIQFGDPIKDCFNDGGTKKITKDFPCTRTLHFMKGVTSNTLNMMVHMRSNDLLWGATGVNIFNYTFMQEYVARILGMDVGTYYHVADNLHYYVSHHETIQRISKASLPKSQAFRYSNEQISASDFHKKLSQLSLWEEGFRQQKRTDLIRFSDPFFDDWANVLYSFQQTSEFEFYNPELAAIMSQKPIRINSRMTFE